MGRVHAAHGIPIAGEKFQRCRRDWNEASGCERLLPRLTIGGRALKILQALPRRMRFEKRAASSVELCVSEWVDGSRYRDTTMVVAEQSDAAPLIDVAMLRLEPAKRLSSWHLAFSLRRHIRRSGADVIVTQQHIATAGRIARVNGKTPVVLQTHNFIDSPRPAAGRHSAIAGRRGRSTGSPGSR